ncbi:MAG: hypothetical protein MZW92_74530 [Comamonadaceae bacterium]|nr:hypothetical protein [Comamonadaceae bacterium]
MPRAAAAACRAGRGRAVRPRCPRLQGAVAPGAAAGRGEPIRPPAATRWRATRSRHMPAPASAASPAEHRRR